MMKLLPVVLMTVASMGFTVFAQQTAVAESPVPGPEIKGYAPQIALAQAITRDGDIVLSVKLPCQVCKPVSVYEDVFFTETVDGREISKITKKEVFKTVCETVYSMHTARLGDPGVQVTNANGKPVSPEEVLQQLKQETAILMIFGEAPADPFYLQTTKPETLVLLKPIEIVQQPVTPDAPPAPAPSP